MLINENTKVTISLVLLVTLMVSLVSASVVISRKITQFENRLCSVEESYIEHRVLLSKIELNENRINSQDVKLAEILTDLKWIRQRMEEDSK